MPIQVEYKHQTGFENFLAKQKNKRVAILYDVNTAPYAEPMIARLESVGATIARAYFPDKELIPTIENTRKAAQIAQGADYVLAVGSGSLNDMAKWVGTHLSLPCGVLATAASMDGYCSKGSALMYGGKKLTDEVQPPEDVLVDLDILCSAPKDMTSSGFADIVGKFTCLADWRLAAAVKGEKIHAEAFDMMARARTECVDTLDGLIKSEPTAVARLIDALIMAGKAMALCGNSRPASGSEHHQSHFLEMDFVRRGEKIPLHGWKVGIGTLVSIEIYKQIKDRQIRFSGCETAYRLAEELPSVARVEEMLAALGCPTRFSQIGVRRETMEDMLENAHTVRDRYTVLTLANELDLMNKLKPILMEKYF